jgi:hypothetical protein
VGKRALEAVKPQQYPLPSRSAQAVGRVRPSYPCDEHMGMQARMAVGLAGMLEYLLAWPRDGPRRFEMRFAMQKHAHVRDNGVDAGECG